MAERKFPWQTRKQRLTSALAGFSGLKGLDMRHFGFLLVLVRAADSIGLWIKERWAVLQVPLTVIAIVHVMLLLFFPAGSSTWWNIGTSQTPGYLTWFQARDAQGFYKTRREDGFILYKLYTQSGEVLRGVFPGHQVTPRLRYDRWAMAGHRAAESPPAVHEQIVNYILQRLPSPPLKLELYAASWDWDRNGFRFPWPGTHLTSNLDLIPLGTYNGFDKSWAPSKEQPRKTSGKSKKQTGK